MNATGEYKNCDDFAIFILNACKVWVHSYIKGAGNANSVCLWSDVFPIIYEKRLTPDTGYCT